MPQAARKIVELHPSVFGIAKDRLESQGINAHERVTIVIQQLRDDGA